MPFFRVGSPLFGSPLLASIFVFCVAPVQAQTALPLVGAPRVLQIFDELGRELSGDFSGVAWERAGGGFFFTREADKTRNIWRARPDSLSTTRFPAWRARPVTALSAPMEAYGAVPLDNNTVFCLSNVGTPQSGTPEIGAMVCRLNVETGGVKPAILQHGPHRDIAVSPSGRFVSFSGRSGETPAIFGAFANGEGNPFLLATPARRAVWLDSQTLIFESLGEPRGLVSRRLSETRARLLLSGSGELAPLGGSVGLVFSARAEKTAQTQLYLMARDGSGLRALNGTEGARRPAPSPSGQSLAFDAPLGNERRIWLAPLEGGLPLWRAPRVSDNQIRHSAVLANTTASTGVPAPVPTPRPAPVALISGVEVTSSTEISPAGRQNNLRALLIRGTTDGPTPLSVVLEWGEGENPRSWQKLAVSQNPMKNGPLALWSPPSSLTGLCTLRLSVTARGGATQSLFRVRLPLQNETGNTTPPNQIVGREPLPRLPLPPPAPIPRAAPTLRPELPRPVPTVAPRPLPTVAPQPRPTAIPTAVPTATPTPAPVRVVPRPTPAPIPTSPPVSAAPAQFVAQFNISGTLARVSPGQKFPVTFWAQNQGTAVWRSDVGAQNSGDSTRIVARWVDFSTGTRRKWNFFWLRGQVAPGGRTRQDLTIVAPTRPGKYKLIYGVVRVPASGSWNAPPYNAPQEAWPGEFGAIAFAVEVARVTEGGGEEN